MANTSKAALGTKRVRDMSYRAHELLFMALRPDTPTKDWKTLADLTGYTYAEIKNFECVEHPVKALINHWELGSNSAIKQLMLHLEQMERSDLLEDLQPFVDETPTPEEAQKKIREGRVITESPTDLTKLDEYDAFLIYAPEDEEFAAELVKKLESPPYEMNICIEYRDIVPGGCIYEKHADIIEKRCKKILLILSENFTQMQDGQSIFQAKVALNLSPGAKEKCLIPILYKPCKVPNIFSFITHLDYTREDTRKYFWDRLSLSLGYKMARPKEKSECQQASKAKSKQRRQKKCYGFSRLFSCIFAIQGPRIRKMHATRPKYA